MSSEFSKLDLDLATTLFCLLYRVDKPDKRFEVFYEEIAGASLKDVVESLKESKRFQGLRAKESLLWVPPGHFYSPVFDYRQKRLAVNKGLTKLPDLSIDDLSMVRFWSDNINLIQSFNFPLSTDVPHSFYTDNSTFCIGDSIIYFSLLGLLRPKRVIEIGTGFSSLLLLESVERHLLNDTEVTLIDPYPQRLLSLLSKRQLQRVKLLSAPIQEVSLNFFSECEPGDIIFIDSTHVLKTDSDVCFELFNILPSLCDGVYIHFHDIFCPFDYPETWIKQGRSWNEAYALRAFLMNQDRYKIIFFNDYFAAAHGDLIAETMPIFLENSGGSLWIRKGL